MQVNSKAIDAAVKQMLEWWMIEDKREAFEAALRKVIARDLAERGTCELYVDYDPQGSLLEAVREAGVECRGSWWSAEGIFQCQKSGVAIDAHGAKVKKGYGAGYKALEVKP